MDKLFTNGGDPDQTPRSAASDLGLHCLPMTLLGVSRLNVLYRMYVLRRVIILNTLCKMVLCKRYCPHRLGLRD